MKYMLLMLAFSLPVLLAAQVPADVKLEKATNPVVKLTVGGGEMIIELYPDVAPKHVESFLTLIKKGFYNGLRFHRVVPGFVIQGGDPLSKNPNDPAVGTGGPGYNIKAEFSSRKHVKGTLAMARSQDPDSAGSQFYICLNAIPHLDGQYTVFGQVVKGYELAEKVKGNDVFELAILQDAAGAAPAPAAK